MTDPVAHFDVFLSYNSTDKPAVETLAQRLLEAGIKPWLDSWNGVPGVPWEEELEEALDTCATCAVLLGPSGVGPWQNEELRVALDRRARDRTRHFRVIPVLLPGADPADPATLPLFLARMTWVDFRGGPDDADAFRRLVAGILGVAPGPGRPESSLAANETIEGHVPPQRQSKEVSMPSSASQMIDLETQYRELERQYQTLTDRIAALDTDIGRELDSERKLVLQERRADLDRERSTVAVEIDRIEQQLAGSSAIPIANRAPVQTSTEPAEALLFSERASLERQLTELRENLLLIEERKSEYVDQTAIPLDLIRQERHTREKIARIEAQLINKLGTTEPPQEPLVLQTIRCVFALVGDVGLSEDEINKIKPSDYPNVLDQLEQEFRRRRSRGKLVMHTRKRITILSSLLKSQDDSPLISNIADAMTKISGEANNAAIQYLEARLEEIRKARSTSSSPDSEADTEVHNLLHLLQLLRDNDLSCKDISRLRVKEMDFRDTFLQDVYARSTTFENCDFRNTFGSVSALAVSPDRSLLAMGDNNGRIFVWDAPELDKLRFCTTGIGHTHTVRSLKFVQPGGGGWYLLSAGDDGTVHRWSINAEGQLDYKTIMELGKEGEEKPEEHQRQTQMRALCANVSPDTRWILAGDERGTLHYVRSNGREYSFCENQGYDWLVAAEFLKIEKEPLLITGFQNLQDSQKQGVLKIWRVRLDDGVLELSFIQEIGLDARLRTLIPGPDGNSFLTGDEDSRIQLYAITRNPSGELQVNPKPCWTLSPPKDKSWGRVWSLAISPDSNYLAAGMDDGVLRVWKLRGCSENPELLAEGRHHTDRIWSVCFINDNQIITGGDDQQLVRWSLTVGDDKQPGLTPDKTMRGYSNRIWTVAAFPHGTHFKSYEDLLVFGGDFGDKRETRKPNIHRFGIYHRREGEVTFDFVDATHLESFQGRIEAIAWHPNGDRLAIAGHAEQIILLQRQTGGHRLQRYNAIPVRSGWVYTVAWHPTEKWLAYGTQGGEVELWKEEAGRKLSLDSELKPVRAVAFSPNGQILAAATEEGEIHCYRLHRRDEYRKTIVNPSDVNPSDDKSSKSPVRALVFHPINQEQSSILASGDDTGTIRLWKVSANGELTQIRKYPCGNGKHHADRIRAVAFNRDGSLLASGDDDGNVIVWRYNEGDGGPSLNSLGVLRPRENMLSPTHKSRVRSLSFFADGDLATCCEAETESVILWRYRYKDKDKSPPKTFGASALYDYESHRVFYAHRLYERLDFTDAEFQGISEERQHITKRLKHLGAIETDETYSARVTQAEKMRDAIRRAVETLYGTSDTPEKRAGTIIGEMEEYLKQLKQAKTRSLEALADWEKKLQNYKKRLCVLLDEHRNDFFLVRGGWEEEEVARFLVRLCFVLRRKEKKSGVNQDHLKNLEEIAQQSSDDQDPLENLEEILHNDEFWSSNKYYTWPFVWATIGPGKPEDLPKEWENRFGKPISLRFLKEDTPFELAYYAPDYRQFFDGEELTPFPDPQTRQEVLHIACTILDKEVRDPAEIEWMYQPEEFKFSDPDLKSLQDQMKLNEDHLMARLYDFVPAGEGHRITCTFQRVPYSCYCVTNLPISFGMRLVGTEKSMLDWLCPPDRTTGKRKLPKLDDCQLSNHLGVDCIVITRDGYLLMYRRLPHEMTDPNMIGFVPSIAMSYYPKKKKEEEELTLPRVQEFCATGDGLQPRHTPTSAIIAAFKRELEVTLKDIHPSLTLSPPLLYLGTFREWARGGKPEMYFLTRSRWSWEEHKEKLPGSTNGEYAPGKKDLQEGDKFKLCDGDFSSQQDFTVMRLRLWSLVQTYERTLQESAKAGIYLLAKACEEAPEKLQTFFRQFEE